MVVMPIGVKPLWDEIQQKLRELELVHHNDAIEAGMHVEALLAEFYAGTQIPRPDGWIERVD